MKVAVYDDIGALIWEHEFIGDQMRGYGTRDPQVLSVVIAMLHRAMTQALGQSGFLCEMSQAAAGWRRPDLPLLPHHSWRFHYRVGDDYIAAGIYESPPGVMWWIKIPLSELPNELVGVDDLKRDGIKLNDRRAITKRAALSDHAPL
jgi:hypothetical protein